MSVEKFGVIIEVNGKIELFNFTVNGNHRNFSAQEIILTDVIERLQQELGKLITNKPVDNKGE